jgi:hypothetical protein
MFHKNLLQLLTSSYIHNPNFCSRLYQFSVLQQFCFCHFDAQFILERGPLIIYDQITLIGYQVFKVNIELALNIPIPDFFFLF